MANSFEDVKKKAMKEPSFIANLIVNPTKALKDANLELTNAKDVKRLELFVKLNQEHLVSVGKFVGVETKVDDWGIGAGCCNGKALMPGDIISKPL